MAGGGEAIGIAGEGDSPDVRLVALHGGDLLGAIDVPQHDLAVGVAGEGARAVERQRRCRPIVEFDGANDCVMAGVPHLHRAVGAGGDDAPAVVAIGGAGYRSAVRLELGDGRDERGRLRLLGLQLSGGDGGAAAFELREAILHGNGGAGDADADE